MNNLYSFVENIRSQVITFAQCKINIGLQITERRSDGFHNLLSLFYPVGLSDVVEAVVNDSGKFTLETWGINIPGSKDDNIIYNVYKLLSQDYQLPGFDFFLGKKIPAGAGLGGGSSDAVQALLLIDKLAELQIAKPALLKYSSMLGSDCTFFLDGKPKFISGRGDIMQDAGIDLSGMHICIIQPGFGISTKEAYGMIQPDSSRIPLQQLLGNPVDQWKSLICNDFEIPVMNKYPVIREIKAQLYVSGAVYAAMSGSGSAVYGLFNNRPGLQHLFNTYFYWEGKI